MASEYLAVNEIVVAFLRSGSNFWLLSPNNRNSNGNVNGFNVNSDGNLNNNNVSNTNGVRPAFKSKLRLRRTKTSIVCTHCLRWWSRSSSAGSDVALSN